MAEQGGSAIKRGPVGAWVEYRLEQQVVAAALASPAAGPQRLADELTSIGVDVNPSNVWRILERHRLSTRRLRYALLTHHRDVSNGLTVADRARTYVGVVGMDRYPVEIDENGMVLIDTSEKLDGPTPGGETINEPITGPSCAGHEES